MSKSIKQILIPTLIGNVLEWYDFVLFGCFMNSFAQLFFHSKSSINSVVFGYGLFACSYLMRPIGAILFGFVGDRFGRKKCLFYSISIMCVSSFLISILPTYQHIGIFASFSFVVIRMLQGIALGGEYSGVATYLIESAPSNRKTFFASFALTGAYSGFVVSSIILLILSWVFTQNDLNTYGWRLGFAFGGIIGLVGYYIRSNFAETDEYQHAVLEKHLYVNPFKDLYINHWRKLLIALAIAVLPAGFSYMFIVYFSSFFEIYGHFSLNKIAQLNLAITIWMVITIPFIGYLSDTIFSRKQFMWFSAISIAIFAIPLMQNLLHYPIVVLIICATLNVMFEANILAEIAGYFPITCRYSGIAITLNLTNGLAGGLAPIIALFLISNTQILVSPMFYIIGLSIISMIGLVITRRNKHSKERS